MPTATATASKTAPKRAEIKTRTTAQTKADAAAVYAHWGLSLNDAINMFLVKSIEVGGLPFELRSEEALFDIIERHTYKAPLDENGVAILPVEWDDYE